jgi:hypothetical protein
MGDQETAQSDSEEQKEQGQDEQQGGSGAEQSDAQAKAQQVEEESEQAKEKVKELEENPPDKLEDWPDDKAKYETFGGPEGEHSYEEGPEKQLGPSSLRHHEDGKVTVAGDEVDNADEYKGEPIPGGPTDSESPRMYGEPDLSDEGKRDAHGSGEDDDSESDDEEEGSEADAQRDDDD